MVVKKVKLKDGWSMVDGFELIKKDALDGKL